MKGKVVFSLDTQNFFQWPEHEREAIKAFLAVHGIPPTRFIPGDASICVRVGPDGQLWLDTWRRVVAEDGKSAPLCEHCPACARQERVEVPLKTAVPLNNRAYYDTAFTDAVFLRAKGNAG